MFLTGLVSIILGIVWLPQSHISGYSGASLVVIGAILLSIGVYLRLIARLPNPPGAERD